MGVLPSPPLPPLHLLLILPHTLLLLLLIEMHRVVSGI
jgi:hypothetical protein